MRETEMKAAFKSAAGKIAVPIRPIGCHLSKPMANHLNIVSPKDMFVILTEWYRVAPLQLQVTVTFCLRN